MVAELNSSESINFSLSIIRKPMLMKHAHLNMISEKPDLNDWKLP